MEKNRYVGVDPGSNPAICVLDEEGEIVDISYIKGDLVTVYKKYGKYCTGNIKETDTVFIEDVHSVYQSSAKSNFSFGRGVGTSAMGLWFVEDFNYVQPKEWQKVIWIDSDKDHGVKGAEKNKATSRRAAERILKDKWEDDLFIPTSKSYKVNHNMIDAFLVAYYGFIKKNKL